MKYHNLRLKSSCVACLLLCESGREAITQKNVIDINSHEETNTKHSQWRHLKFTVFECARNYRPFRSAISALVWASPNLFQQKQTGLPWTDREALCQPTPLWMKCLWEQLHEQLCQQSRKDCNLWGEVITEQHRCVLTHSTYDCNQNQQFFSFPVQCSWIAICSSFWLFLPALSLNACLPQT